MSSAQQKKVSSVGIYVILASIVAAGVLMILYYNVAGSIVFLIGFFVGLMVMLYPALFSGTETEQKRISQANTEDFKKRLSLIISEGSSIVQGVESTSFIIHLGKVVLPFVLERKDLDSLESFVEALNLPSPVHQIYLRYIQWNRDCESFF
jgi:hypothetical protein